MKKKDRFYLISSKNICSGMVVAPMFIYACSKNYWKSINPVYRIILFTVLLMALTEQLLRSSIMNIIIGIPWEYQILSSIPSYANYLTISLVICLFMEMVMNAKHFKFLKYLLFAVIVTALLILINKFTHNAVATL